MEADHILEVNRITLGISSEAVEIFNVAKTVASERELVSSVSEANISDVESLFAVIGSTRIWKFISLTKSNLSE